MVGVETDPSFPLHDRVAAMLLFRPAYTISDRPTSWKAVQSDSYEPTVGD